MPDHTNRRHQESIWLHTGVLKGEYHAKLTDMKQFVTMLVVESLLKTAALRYGCHYGYGGQWPHNGRPRRIGALLFSSDPVAIDATAAEWWAVPDSLEMIRLPGIGPGQNG